MFLLNNNLLIVNNRSCMLIDNLLNGCLGDAMRKLVSRYDFERYDVLANVIGIRTVMTYINVSHDILSKAFLASQDFSTLPDYIWNGKSPFDASFNMRHVSLAAASFRYLLKIRSSEFNISIQDVVNIMKHVASFYIVKAEPDFNIDREV